MISESNMVNRQIVSIAITKSKDLSPAFLKFVKMIDDTLKQAKTSRPLPAANQKSAGFAAFRLGAQRSKKARALGSASASGSTTAPPTDNVRPKPKPKPQGIGRTVKNNPTSKAPDRHDPDYQVNISRNSFISESARGKKRKLDEIEIIELESHEGSIEVLNSEEPRNTEKHNKAGNLVKAALAKIVEGEKERLRLETCLRQQIASLESKLQQEKKDHDDSKQRIHSLERGLQAAASNLELANTLVQATSAQLIAYANVGRDKELTES